MLNMPLTGNNSHSNACSLVQWKNKNTGPISPYVESKKKNLNHKCEE